MKGVIIVLNNFCIVIYQSIYFLSVGIVQYIFSSRYIILQTRIVEHTLWSRSIDIWMIDT